MFGLPIILFFQHKKIIGNPPQGLLVMVGFFYVYLPVILFLFFRNFQFMDPELVNGHYETDSHGTITRHTLEEFQIIHRANILCPTALFLIFASFAFTVFFPKKEKEEAKN